MHIDWCPHGPKWEELKTKIGPVEGMRACMAENRIPDASEFPKGGKYSDIVLQPSKWADYSHIEEFGERYRAIADKKAELQAQGAQISGLSANGFRYVMPEGRNLNYNKLTSNQKLKYELQSEISRAISTGERESKIGNALSIIGPIKRTGQKGQRGGQEIIRIWKHLQEGGLEYKKSLGEQWSKGGEHEVYEGSGNKLIKVKFDLEDIDEMEIYLKKLIIHNHIFKNTAYKLLGFIKRNSNIEPVVEQDVISNTSIYSPDKINSILSAYGFDKVSDTEYINREVGISIDDLFPRNVFFHENIPYFIDPIIGIEAAFYRPAIKNKPDTQLDNKVKGFLKSIGVEVQRLADTGQNFAAMADTINGVIQVVDGKAGIDTLGHEATHMFLDLLDDDSKLLRDIVKDVVNRDEYDAVYEQYKNDPQYQKSILTADEQKRYNELQSKVVPTHDYLGDISKPDTVLLQGTGENFYVTYAIVKEGNEKVYLAFPEGQSPIEIEKSVIDHGVKEGMEPMTTEEKQKFIEGYASIDKQEKINKGGFMLTKEERGELKRLEHRKSKTVVDEIKMAKEAAAHIIDKIIVGRYKDKKAMKWWERLWKFIKELFTGKSLDSYETVAEDILSDKTEKLSKSKIQKMKEANERGEIYYELSKADEDRVRTIRDRKGTTDIQKAIIDTIYLKPDHIDEAIAKVANESGIRPHDRVILDEASHTYTDIHGEVYNSTTRKISGEFDEQKKEIYAINAAVGSDIDKLLQHAILGKSHKDLDSVDTPTLSGDMKTDLFSKMREFLAEHTVNGEVPLTQVVVADPISKTAGSIDLLLVHPKGFARIVDLKTSVNKAYEGNKLSKTYTSEWKQNEGSVFNGLTFNDKDEIIPITGSEQPIKLSKQLQHGIQTGSYAKMLELQGIPVTGIDSWHINVDIDKENNTVRKWRDEGIVQHSIEDNQPYIDAIVPTPIDFNNPSKLQENRPGYDYSKEPEYDNLVDAENLKKQSQKMYNTELDKSVKAADIAKEIVKAIGQRIQYIENLNNTQQVPVVQDKTIMDLTDMKHDFMRYLNKGKYSSILNRWMEYTIKQSATTARYLNDPVNITNTDENNPYTAIAAQARKFIQSYAYINELVDQVHGTQIAKFNEAVGAVNDLRKSLENSIKSWFEFHGKAADTKYLEQEIDEYINGNPKDINIFGRLFAAPSATSSIPVSLAFKEISDAVFKWNEAHEEFKTGVKILEKQLHKELGVKGFKEGVYDFMTHPKTAQFVIRESPAQLQKEANAWKALQDDNGERKQWRTDESDEAYAHNIQLQKDLIHYTRLLEAEHYVPAEWDNGEIVSDAHIEPGEFYEYKPVPIYDEDGKITDYDDFVAKRDEFEKLVNGKWVIQFSPDAVQGLRWLKEDGKYYAENPDGTKGRLLTDNERKGLAALEYRYKYYTPYEKSEYKPVYEKGVFTGKVVPRDEEDKIGWRVKPQYKSMRDVSTNKVDLRDPKYIAMQTDPTPQGRAKWGFYQGFMEKWEELYRKMPSNRVEQIKGKMPVQSSSLWRQVMDSDTPQTMLALLGDKFKNMFNSTYIGERMVDEAGNIKQSIPIGFSGSLKDQQAIDKKKAEIQALDNQWKANKNTATKQQRAEYKKQRGILSAELTTAEAKIMPYQVEKDIVKSLIDTANKIEAYDQMSRIENNFLMIREMAAIKADKNELAKTDANGRSLFKKVINELGTSIKKALTGGGAGSNELRRIDDMMTMLLYKAEEYPGSFWAKIEQLPITLSALNLFLINPPVSMGVHIMMNSIHLKEAAVGQFFNAKNYGKAKFEVNKAVPAYIQNSAIQSSGGAGKKYASYPEAWVAKTQAFTKGLSDEAGGVRDLLKMEHYVEWTGVATGAIAIAYHTPIKGEDGTISNMYEIFTQQPDGTLVVKPNYAKEWDKKKFSFNRLMADYQNRFHGAYAPLERAAITQYPGGKSIMYLHKWIPASIWSMWSPRAVHSNLGVTEGQVVTLFTLIKDLREYEGNIMKKFQTGYRTMIPKGAVGNPNWDKLSPEEKEQADRKAYEDDPNFRKADGSFDEKKAQRDRDTRRLELSNMKRNLVTVMYLIIATAGYMLLKSLAQDAESDNTRRWANFLAKSFDRLRKQQLFAIPVLGLEEEYSLLKSPIASLRTMGEFADALSATFSIPVPPYGANYYTTGVHKGELKAKVKWQAILPGANVIKWYKEQNNPSYWLR